jgi:cardiolipin synthase
VDDDIGFCGGMNVSVDYAGPALGNGRFRDTHARFEGPCVQDLARVFAASVHSATGERLALPVRQEPYASGVFAQVLQSDVRRRRRHIQRALHQTVSRSGHHCFLTSPYFVPPPKLTSALVRAKRRGVDVKVLTAGLSDVPLVRLASQHLYGKLLRAGVGIYEMFGRTLHAKTATIDGIYASVGSFNLDRWSYLRNLEVNVAILDARLALELEERFASDLAMSQEVHLPTWEKRTPYERVLAWIAYQFLRL